MLALSAHKNIMAAGIVPHLHIANVQDGMNIPMMMDPTLACWHETACMSLTHTFIVPFTPTEHCYNIQASHMRTPYSDSRHALILELCCPGLDAVFSLL